MKSRTLVVFAFFGLSLLASTANAEIRYIDWDGTGTADQTAHDSCQGASICHLHHTLTGTVYVNLPVFVVAPDGTTIITYQFSRTYRRLAAER